MPPSSLSFCKPISELTRDGTDQIQVLVPHGMSLYNRTRPKTSPTSNEGRAS